MVWHQLEKGDKMILFAADTLKSTLSIAEKWQPWRRFKNHTDVRIFQLRVCAGATNSRSQSQI